MEKNLKNNDLIYLVSFLTNNSKLEDINCCEFRIPSKKYIYDRIYDNKIKQFLKEEYEEFKLILKLHRKKDEDLINSLIKINNECFLNDNNRDIILKLKILNPYGEILKIFNLICSLLKTNNSFDGDYYKFEFTYLPIKLEEKN